MSYTNSTTHYGFPLPLGTDLTVPMDYNQAFNDIDEHLFDAETDASTAATAAANAVETANGAAADVADLETTVNAHDGRLTSLEQHDIVQDNKIDALETSTGIKFDSVGIADAYLNGLTYDVGDVVTYNGQRYKCITAVTAAEPFDSDKWQGEDVQTVIDDIKSDLEYKRVFLDDTGVSIISGNSITLDSDVSNSKKLVIHAKSHTSDSDVEIPVQFELDIDSVSNSQTVTLITANAAGTVSFMLTGTVTYNKANPTTLSFNVGRRFGITNDSGVVSYTDTTSSIKITKVYKVG